MRSTNEIVVAVKECQPCTEEELRLCICSLDAMRYFAVAAADKMADGIITGQKSVGFRARLWKDDAEKRFRSNKIPVDKYLGPGYTPGTPEHTKLLRMGKAIFKKATGIDLDT